MGALLLWACPVSTHCAVVGIDYNYAHMINDGSPVGVGLCTHCAVVGIDYMHAHMISNGSPAVVGFFTQGAVVGMEYMYAHMTGNGKPIVVGRSTRCSCNIVLLKATQYGGWKLHGFETKKDLRACNVLIL